MFLPMAGTSDGEGLSSELKNVRVMTIIMQHKSHCRWNKQDKWLGIGSICLG